MSPICSPERYVTAASRLSSTPTPLAWLFTGTHTTPPESAVVPPSDAVASSTVTSAPAYEAARAADKPAAPEPTTMTDGFFKVSLLEAVRGDRPQIIA